MTLYPSALASLIEQERHTRFFRLMSAFQPLSAQIALAKTSLSLPVSHLKGSTSVLKSFWMQSMTRTRGIEEDVV